ncbi:MAG: hypothetical protein Q9220_007410 [cf. Caloplaca sp. 1 TL-2023]
MSDGKLKAAILIVSDTASQDPSTDKAGSLLKDVITNAGGAQWTVSDQQIVSDDVLAIQRQVMRWSDGDDPYNLIVTTGGTGFTRKDNTPEAIIAVMSRPVAGVRNKSIIVTLPGSPKGAKENLLSILKQLPHACKQAAGEDSRTAHVGGVKALEQAAGMNASSSVSDRQSHSHHHHHTHKHSHNHGSHAVPKPHTDSKDLPKSNNPKEGPSRRYRESPYPMRSVEEALELIFKNTPAPRPVLASVDIDVGGYVLAENVKADEPVPAFRASIVDGYAIIVDDDAPSPKGTFPVVSISHASPGHIPPLCAGQIARITTGAPLPPGATAVAMVEDTIIRSVTADSQEEKDVEILTDEIKPGENVREIGSDVKGGDIILKKGVEISTTGGELGLLASVGKGDVLVYEKPVVGVLSTGDELVPHHSQPGSLELGEVRDTNRPTLMAAIQGWGFEVVDLGVASDK